MGRSISFPMPIQEHPEAKVLTLHIRGVHRNMVALQILVDRVFAEVGADAYVSLDLPEGVPPMANEPLVASARPGLALYLSVLYRDKDKSSGRLLERRMEVSLSARGHLKTRLALPAMALSGVGDINLCAGMLLFFSRFADYLERPGEAYQQCLADLLFHCGEALQVASRIRRTLRA